MLLLFLFYPIFPELARGSLSSEQTNYTLGKYANLRLDFMKMHRRGTYTTLLTEGRLNEYLHDIDIQARRENCACGCKRKRSHIKTFCRVDKTSTRLVLYITNNIDTWILHSNSSGYV